MPRQKLARDARFPPLSICPREKEPYLHTDLHMRVHGGAVPNSDTVGRARTPIAGEWTNHGPSTRWHSAVKSNSTSARNSIAESQKHYPKTAKAEKRKAERSAVVWGSGWEQGTLGVMDAPKLGCDS